MTGHSMIVALLAALCVLLWNPSGPRTRPARPRRDRSRARDRDADVEVALAMDLLAAALESGMPIGAALTAVAGTGTFPWGDHLTEVARRLAVGSPDPWADTPSFLAPLARVTRLVIDAGVPAAGMLRDGAEEVRRRSARDAEAAAARLGVRLVLPLGLCALPAFVAWSVVPVVISLVLRMA